MDIELIAQERKENGTIYDLSEVAFDIDWETEITEQPGKLTFSFVDQENITLPEGSIVRLKVAGQGVFFGYIFKRSKSEKEVVKITAYDQLRYLKNKNTYVISDMTASDIFTKLCKDSEMKHEVKKASSYKIANRVFDDKTLYEIIQRAIDETLAYTGKWYFIRDNFGTLEFNDLEDMKSDLVIGDLSLANNYSFDSSIDDDTYNQIKLVQENKESKKREVYIVKDSSTIAQWGTLQYYEKMDEKANPAQIKEKAEKLLKAKNRVTKTLKVTALGSFEVFAGRLIVLDIEALKPEGVEQKHFIVTKCTHKLRNNAHTMTLDLMVV